MIEPLKASIVLDDTLAPGHAANVAACLAAGFGASRPGFAGTPLEDGAGLFSRGSANYPIAILRGAQAGLQALLRGVAQEPGDELLLVLFPSYAQKLHSHLQYHDLHATRDHRGEPLLGLGLLGPAARVKRWTGALPLWR